MLNFNCAVRTVCPRCATACVSAFISPARLPCGSARDGMVPWKPSTFSLDPGGSLNRLCNMPPMSEKLPLPSMDGAQIELVLRSHDLMKLYTDERIANPYSEEETTTAYLGEAISLLTAAIASATDPEPLMDALLLTKCFAATVLLSPRRPVQISMFLNWVQSVEEDQSKWTSKLKEKLLSTREMTPEFWKLVTHYTLVGKFSDAVDMLQNSAKAADSDIGYLIELLNSYPLDAEKYSVFMHWRQNALVWLNNLDQRQRNSFSSEIEKLALIFAGDIPVIVGSASGWIPAVSGLYLFADPSAESLESHFSIAVAKHPVNTIPTWEEGCKALFEDKSVAALGCLQLLDISTTVVISEFCSERGLLDKYSVVGGKAGGGVREELALLYIKSCLAEPPLVELGTEMLVNVGSAQAKKLAEELLPELVRRTPEFAEVAIDTAELLGLAGLELQLCKLAAEANASERRYVSAINYYFKAADHSNVRSVAWELFKQILITKQPVGDEQTLAILREAEGIDKIELPISIKDNLAPSAVLLALLDAIDEENVEDIITNLNGLLTFPDPPLEYYPLLVGLVSTVSGSLLTLKNMAMLMDALDSWDLASETTKRVGFKLIGEAAANPRWHNALAADQDPEKFVWFLRRQLAKEVTL